METTRTLGYVATWAILHFAASATGPESLPLPSVFRPCSRADPKLSECATTNAIPAIPKLKNGLPEYGIPPLDPLFIKRIKIDRKLLDLDFEMHDVLLHGLSQSKVVNVRVGLKPPVFAWTLFAPKAVFLGKYSAEGKLLLLPITGKGDINITLIDLEYTCRFDFDFVRGKGGEEFLAPKSSSIQHKLKRIYFNLEDLFNGNKVLGDTMNAFLNENWREIEESFGEVFAAEVAVAVKSIVDGVTSKVSFNRFFPDQV